MTGPTSKRKQCLYKDELTVVSTKEQKWQTKSTTNLSTLLITDFQLSPRNIIAFKQIVFFTTHTYTKIADQPTHINAITQNRPSSIRPNFPLSSYLPFSSHPANKSSTKTQHTTSPHPYFNTASSYPTSLALAMPHLPTEIPSECDAALSRRWTLFLCWSDSNEEEVEW